MEAAVVASPEPSCATAAPMANSRHPIVNADAVTQLTRRRRTRIADGAGNVVVTPPASGRTAITPRLRADLESQVASPPPGSAHLRRLVKGPPPSARRSIHP